VTDVKPEKGISMKSNRLSSLAILSVTALVLATPIVWGNTGVSDSEINAKVVQRLNQKKVGPDVDVKVEDGMVTLGGTVESVALKETAGSEASRIKGISSVPNNILVDAGAVSDDKILHAASRGIRGYSFYTIFDNIELKSVNGQVLVSGQVTQPWRREDIGRIVASVRGVRSVENNLEVLPLSPFDNEIRFRVARAIYRDPVLYRYGFQAYPPIHIIVKNGNVTLTGVLNNSLEKIVAERASRFAATYFGLDNQLRVESEIAKEATD